MKAVGQSIFLPLMTWSRLLLVLAVVVGGFGCKPKIGEDCATSVDCSLSGDRLCDITLPGGYCTVFNCEPNGCPDEAACVAFSEGTCSSASVSTRFRRTFCMRTCEDDSDCRGGAYQCLDLSRDDSRRVVDRNANQRICGIPSGSMTPAPPDPPVCFPSDASFDVSRPEAGPPRRDAEVDAADVFEAGEAAPNDVLDSSHVETGSDVTPDAADVTPDAADVTPDAGNDAEDAAEETTSD